MLHYVTLAAVSYFSVFILGFQSRNINSGQYKWAAACSIGIGLSNTFVWRSITMTGAGWADWLIYSAMGGCGIVSAMYTHKRWIKPAIKD